MDYKENLNDTIYPLNFILRYVSTKRDELAAMETATLRNMLQLKDCSDTLNKFITQNRNEDGTLSAEYVDKLLDFLTECQKKTATIGHFMTNKSIIFEDMNNMLRQTQALTSDIIMHDELTLAYNRYFYLANADKLYESAVDRNGLSMAFIDIDNFRDFNTNHGHDFGDRALKHFSNIVNDNISKYEQTYLIRVGGDEFVILNGGDLSYEDFVECLNAISTSLSSSPMEYDGNKIKISISVGAANSNRANTSSMLELYKLTDGKLYQAKESGRNRIVA
ncbi:MAG: GGDEF domain-containing protein [Butyrivibrio sp.]|jgi:diguanylate cyclase (GGDEF)-like protein|nr:GGDEF domain-containing protein [Butyrivibrio sp.]